MNFLSLLAEASSKKDTKEILYTFKVTDEEDEVVFFWYVVDAQHGYTVFNYQRPNDRHTMPVFQGWFQKQNEAIEFAVDSGRAEKIAKGL